MRHAAPEQGRGLVGASLLKQQHSQALECSHGVRLRLQHRAVESLGLGKLPVDMESLRLVEHAGTDHLARIPFLERVQAAGPTSETIVMGLFTFGPGRPG